MPLSAVQRAKRSLVSCIKAMAERYTVRVDLSRESTDPQVRAAYRKVSRGAHPDRGGDSNDQQQLNAAHDAWAAALRATKGRGGLRPPSDGGPCDAPGDSHLVVLPEATPRQERTRTCRIRSRGVLLTYQKFRDAGAWADFLDFVRTVVKEHGVHYWCATMETNKDSTYHLHLMLQFKAVVERRTAAFAFAGRMPNGQANDLLGDGWGGRRYQQSLDRGFFYVWAEKEGTVRDAAGELCVAGNYQPAWTAAEFKYAVQGRWIDALLRAHKLSFDVCESLIYLARDGVVQRKRNLDALRERAEEDETKVEVEARVCRIQSNRRIYESFKPVPEALAWLSLFEEDALRYPLLVVHAPSFTGKTEWSMSLFTRPFQVKIGAMPHFPEAMRRFSRKLYNGLVLDDVRDVLFLSNHQEKLQGKYSGPVEFASTAGGTCAYWRDLYCIPVVVTVNDSTKNLGLLQPGAHDFLGKRENVHYLRFAGKPGDAPPMPAEAP